MNGLITIADERRLLCAKEVAAMLGCSLRTVERYARAGKLGEIIEIGRIIRIPAENIEALKRKPNPKEGVS